jgi:hypothetical protein
MMIARWSIDAKFGNKQVVIDMMNSWIQNIGPEAGISRDKVRMLTGSIGALEATLQVEHTITSLAELETVWDKLANSKAHQQWGKELEPFVVSGSSRWEIYRELNQ